MSKIAIWRAFQGKKAWKVAPMLVFALFFVASDRL
jgi:hypothetical protein